MQYLFVAILHRFDLNVYVCIRKTKFINMKIAVFISIMLCTSMFAQDYESTGKHYIGLSTSVAQGSGLTYRYEPNRFAVQLATIPVFFGNGDSYISLGLSGFYKITSSRRFDLLSYISVAYNVANITPNVYIDEFGNEFEYYDNSPFDNSLLSIIGNFPGLSSSIGAGGNVHFIKDKLIFSFQLGYAMRNLDRATPFTAVNANVGMFFKF